MGSEKNAHACQLIHSQIIIVVTLAPQPIRALVSHMQVEPKSYKAHSSCSEHPNKWKEQESQRWLNCSAPKQKKGVKGAHCTVVAYLYYIE